MKYDTVTLYLGLKNLTLSLFGTGLKISSDNRELSPEEPVTNLATIKIIKYDTITLYWAEESYFIICYWFRNILIQS